MQNPNGVQMMSVKDIAVEDGALDMFSSPDMEPYLTHAEAALTGHGSDSATRALSQLPLETRYLWRVVSSLKEAFCDFDKSSVRADLGTMSAADFDEVVTSIDRRVVQFAMLLRTVHGSTEMERMLLAAVEIAKSY